MKLFLDDERDTAPGFVRAYWPHEAIAILERGQVTLLSLDHDLGDDARGTGFDVLLWLEEAVATRGFDPPQIAIHSANAAARTRMLGAIRSLERLCGRKLLIE